ncbi:MAG: molybdopterin-dependent oxidoreductase, partial [Candidatus Aminicenantes bacterium]|nr:molybdopterin-dependent oxidoreductase [Candidatus Aminicenantes bacterium]
PRNKHCGLQDVVDIVGLDGVKLPSIYRNLELRRDDPFIDRDYNMCILCGRCVRVCAEVRGASVLTFINRGPRTVVGAALDRPLSLSGCQFCGACVDLCPTAALSERAARPELLPEATRPLICALCSQGCTLEAGLRAGRILTTQPARDGAVNHGQACVRGRFVVRDLVQTSERLLKPHLRRDGHLEEAGWDEALDRAAAQLEKYRGEEAALLLPGDISVEDGYLCLTFAREALGTTNISFSVLPTLEATLDEIRAARDWAPDSGFDLREVGEARTIFVMGADLAVTHPMVWLEVVKALRRGGRLVVAATGPDIVRRTAAVDIQVMPGRELITLGRLLSLIPDGAKSHAEEGLAEFKPSLKGFLKTDVKETGASKERLTRAAKVLAEDGPSVILAGPGLCVGPDRTDKVAALVDLALLTGARFIPLPASSNERGLAELARRLGIRPKPATEILDALRRGEVKAVYAAGTSLKFAGDEKPEVLILQAAHRLESAEEADVLLPAALFPESGGSLINAEGRLQMTAGVIPPAGEARPGWKILCALAGRLGAEGFRFAEGHEVREAISALWPGFGSERPDFAPRQAGARPRFIPLASGRKASRKEAGKPFLLAVTANADLCSGLDLSRVSRGYRAIRGSHFIVLSPADAKKLNLKDGDELDAVSAFGALSGIVRVSNLVPPGVVTMRLVPTDFVSVRLLGAGAAPVALRRRG